FFSLTPRLTPELYTLSLHDALPILSRHLPRREGAARGAGDPGARMDGSRVAGGIRTMTTDLRTISLSDADKLRVLAAWFDMWDRSEEHTSELQSRVDLVCRLLLEKK